LPPVEDLEAQDNEQGSTDALRRFVATVDRFLCKAVLRVAASRTSHDDRKLLPVSGPRVIELGSLILIALGILEQLLGGAIREVKDSPSLSSCLHFQEQGESVSYLEFSHEGLALRTTPSPGLPLLRLQPVFDATQEPRSICAWDIYDDSSTEDKQQEAKLEEQIQEDRQKLCKEEESQAGKMRQEQEHELRNSLEKKQMEEESQKGEGDKQQNEVLQKERRDRHEKVRHDRQEGACQEEKQGQADGHERLELKHSQAEVDAEGMAASRSQEALQPKQPLQRLSRSEATTEKFDSRQAGTLWTPDRHRNDGHQKQPSPPVSGAASTPLLWKQLRLVASPQRHPFLQQLLDRPLKGRTPRKPPVDPIQEVPADLASPSVATMSPCTPAASTAMCGLQLDDFPSPMTHTKQPPQRPVKKVFRGEKKQLATATPYQIGGSSPSRAPRGDLAAAALAAPTDLRRSGGRAQTARRRSSLNLKRRPASAPPDALQAPKRPLSGKHLISTGPEQAQRGKEGNKCDPSLDDERLRSRHLCEELRKVRAQLLVTGSCTSTSSTLPAPQPPQLPEVMQVPDASDLPAPSRWLSSPALELPGRSMALQPGRSSSAASLEEVSTAAIRVEQGDLEVLLCKMRGLRQGSEGSVLVADTSAAVRTARRAFAEAELALLSMDTSESRRRLKTSKRGISVGSYG